MIAKSNSIPRLKIKINTTMMRMSNHNTMVRE